jgi:hypothetical protein
MLRLQEGNGSALQAHRRQTCILQGLLPEAQTAQEILKIFSTEYFSFYFKYAASAENLDL